MLASYGTWKRKLYLTSSTITGLDLAEQVNLFLHKT